MGDNPIEHTGLGGTLCTMKRTLWALVALMLVGAGVVVATRVLPAPSYAVLMCRDVDAPYDARPLSRPEIVDLDSAADAPSLAR